SQVTFALSLTSELQSQCNMVYDVERTTNYGPARRFRDCFPNSKNLAHEFKRQCVSLRNRYTFAVFTLSLASTALSCLHCGWAGSRFLFNRNLAGGIKSDWPRLCWCQYLVHG